MAESTLSITFGDIYSAVGHYLGHGRAFTDGSITVATTNVTLVSSHAVWPQAAASKGKFFVLDDTPATQIRNVTGRTSNTVITINTTFTSASGTANYIYGPWNDEEFMEIKAIVEAGLAQFYHPPAISGEGSISHEWGFMTPEVSFTIYADRAAVAGETINAGTYDATLDRTPVTRAAGSQTFDETMPGMKITFTGGGTYVIDDYTSTTAVMVEGDASAETDGVTYTLTSIGNYRLPDNHAGFVGDLYYDESENSFYKIQLTNPQRIHHLRQFNIGAISPAARSIMAAERPLSSTTPGTTPTTTGQRMELLVWPIPTGDWTIRGQHHELQNSLNFNDYPMGGQAHGETIVESCLAMAEQRIDDTQGNHTAAFMRMLQASVSRDRNAFAPNSWGTNSDGSDRMSISGRRYLKAALYEGTAYWG